MKKNIHVHHRLAKYSNNEDKEALLHMGFCYARKYLQEKYMCIKIIMTTY